MRRISMALLILRRRATVCGLATGGGAAVAGAGAGGAAGAGATGAGRAGAGGAVSIGAGSTAFVCRGTGARRADGGLGAPDLGRPF